MKTTMLFCGDCRREYKLIHDMTDECPYCREEQEKFDEKLRSSLSRNLKIKYIEKDHTIEIWFQNDFIDQVWLSR